MDFRATLLEETEAFGTLVRDADWDTAVPTCGDWTLAQLFRHVGRGNRWCAQIISERRTTPLAPRDVHDGKPPEGLDAAIEWLNGGAQAILDAVDQVGADTSVWTFTGPEPAEWWIRRRVHEATVHRADAVLALGGEPELAPEVAADGVTEWLQLASALADRDDPPLARGATLHLHATDDGLGPSGEWIVAHGDDGISWSHAHAKGEAAVRGRALDLLLGITRRRDTGLDIVGDASVWQGWLERTPF